MTIGVTSISLSDGRHRSPTAQPLGPLIVSDPAISSGCEQRFRGSGPGEAIQILPAGECQRLVRPNGRPESAICLGARSPRGATEHAAPRIGRGVHYVVAYDGLDPLTGKERRRWHSVGHDRDEADLEMDDLGDALGAEVWTALRGVDPAEVRAGGRTGRADR